MPVLSGINTPRRIGHFLSRYIPCNHAELTDNTSHGGYYFTIMTPKKKKFTRKTINRRKKNTPRSPQRILAQARQNTDPSKGSHRKKAWKYSKFVVLPASQELYEKVYLANIWSGLVWSGLVSLLTTAELPGERAHPPGLHICPQGRCLYNPTLSE